MTDRNGTNDQSGAAKEGSMEGNTPSQRAADAILLLVADRFRLREGETTRGMYSEITAIIDRETAVPDVLAALRDIAATAEYGLMGRSAVRCRKMLATCARKARAALAKAEGKEG